MQRKQNEQEKTKKKMKMREGQEGVWHDVKGEITRRRRRKTMVMEELIK